MPRIVIDRLSQLHGHRIAATCPACRHCADLDATAIMATHGDLMLEGLQSRLRCDACGHRPCEITLLGPGGWDGTRTPL